MSVKNCRQRMTVVKCLPIRDHGMEISLCSSNVFLPVACVLEGGTRRLFADLSLLFLFLRLHRLPLSPLGHFWGVVPPFRRIIWLGGGGSEKFLHPPLSPPTPNGKHRHQHGLSGERANRVCLCQRFSLECYPKQTF